MISKVSITFPDMLYVDGVEIPVRGDLYRLFKVQCVLAVRKVPVTPAAQRKVEGLLLCS